MHHVHGHPRHVVASNLDLARVNPDPHSDVRHLEGLSDGQGALDGPAETVEGASAMTGVAPRLPARSNHARKAGQQGSHGATARPG